MSYFNIGLSLRIRRGDKIARHEADFIPDKKFIDTIQNLYDHENIKEINSTRTIYIASNDDFSNMKKILPSNYIIKDYLPNIYQKGFNYTLMKNFRVLL